MVPSDIKLFELKIEIEEKKNSILHKKQVVGFGVQKKIGYSYNAYPVEVKQQPRAPQIETYVVYFQTPFPLSFTPALL